MTETPTLRPVRRPLDAFGDSFNVFLAHARPLFAALVRFPLPLLIAASVGFIVVYTLFQRRVALDSFGFDDIGWLLAVVALALVSYYASMWLWAMTLTALRYVADGRSIEEAPLREEAAPFVWRLLGVGLLGGLCALPIILLVLIPCLGWAGMLILGPMMAGWILVAQVVLVNERRGVLESLKRSHELLKGTYWGVAGALLLMLIVLGVLSMAAQAPVFIATIGQAVTTGEAPVTTPLWAMPFQVLGQVISIFTTVLLLIFGALLYYSRIEATEHAGLRARVDALGDGPVEGATTDDVTP